jgi:hypothetical protein
MPVSLSTSSSFVPEYGTPLLRTGTGGSTTKELRVSTIITDVVHLIMRLLLLSATFALSYLCLTDTVVFVTHALNVNTLSQGSCVCVPPASRSLLRRSNNIQNENVVLCSLKQTSKYQEDGDGQVDSKWKARFTPPNPLPAFQWKGLDNVNVDPAEKSYSCCRLLAKDCFMDKSAALYFLLQDLFDYDDGDFQSVPIRLVYPRRFAKTTLLGFIEAVFSPVPKLEVFDMEKVKAKIAALQCGEELLSFGLHPVLRLELIGISSVRALNSHIDRQMELAGLENFAKKKKRMAPAERVSYGVTMLNEKFMAETGVATKTIVLIDEHDNLFRERKVSKEKEKLMEALLDLFSLGKSSAFTGISLLVFCGLTCMVGSGLSSMNNLVDVSRMTKYHGLCGISAKELVHCAHVALDPLANEKYGETFDKVLQIEFAPKWSGFRFGLDSKVGELDPNSPEGALFSPLDVWEIIRSLVVTDYDQPSSRWIQSMGAEFEFTSFANKYTDTPDGLYDLLENLEGGWVDATDSDFDKMTREDYLLLQNDVQVKKVLLELGLLRVKTTKGDMVLLQARNDLVFENAVKLLANEACPGLASENLAMSYISYTGFGNMLSRAAVKVGNLYGGTGRNVVFPDNALQDFLFKELLYRFPSGGKFHPTLRFYQLLSEVRSQTRILRSMLTSITLILVLSHK